MSESCKVSGMAGDTQQGSGEHIPVSFFPQQLGFQQHLGQLFDIQRHPICFGDNVLDHFCWQSFAPRQMCKQRLDLRALQTVERYRRHVGAHRPWRDKVRTEGQDSEHRYCRRLFEDQTQRL
jgi:hypothetical protein